MTLQTQESETHDTCVRCGRTSQRAEAEDCLAPRLDGLRLGSTLWTSLPISLILFVEEAVTRPRKAGCAMGGRLKSNWGEDRAVSVVRRAGGRRGVAGGGSGGAASTAVANQEKLRIDERFIASMHGGG